jgi:transcriptional regulator with XRE-family HTH domain
MSDGWRSRIEDTIKRDGWSLREVSLRAGVSHGYLHGVLRDGKEPTLDRFLKICSALQLSAVYVLTGISIGQEDQAILSAMSRDDRLRHAILSLIDVRRS